MCKLVMCYTAHVNKYIEGYATLFTNKYAAAAWKFDKIIKTLLIM